MTFAASAWLRDGLRQASLVLLFVFSGANICLAAEAQFPFKRDPILWNSPRASPAPIGFEDLKSFHQQLVQLPEGGLAISFVDVLLPAGAEPLVIKRQYRSGLLATGIFGVGWTSNLDVHLVVSPGGALDVTEGDGRVTRYENLAADIYTSEVGTNPPSSVRRVKDRWVREWVNDETEVFDSLGRVELRATRNDALKFSYQGRSLRPVQIADALGHVAQLAYRDNLLVQVDFAPSRTVRYTYRNNFLAAATDTFGRRTEFAYTAGKLTALLLPDGSKLGFAFGQDATLQQVSGPGAAQTTFAWQVAGDVAGVRLTATPAVGGPHVLEIAPAAVDTAEWGLRSAQQMALRVQRTLPTGEKQSSLIVADKVLTDDRGDRRIFDPNAAPGAEPISEWQGSIHYWRTRFSPAKVPSRDARLQYDAAGRAISVTLDGGLTESWQWDAADRIVHWTDADGSVAQYEYDVLDRPVRTTVDGQVVATASYNELGLLAHLTNARGEERRYSYDASGNLTGIVTGGGFSAQFNNDPAGRPIEIRADNQPILRLRYDDAGHLTGLDNLRGRSSTFSYDARGNLLKQAGTAGVVSYRYDTDGRLTGVSFPDGREVEVATSANGQRIVARSPGEQIVRNYDNQQRLRSEDVATLGRFSFDYDDKGRVVAATDPSGKGLKRSYDAMGRLVAEVDGAGRGIRYEYDAGGQLTAFSSDVEKAAFAYDKSGAVSVQYRRGDETSELRYNAAGQLLDYRDRLGASRTYEYGPAGLARITGTDGDTLRYEYDQAGRVVAIHHDVGGKSTAKAFTYDDSGRVTGVTHEDQASETFRYDNLGRLTAMRDRLGHTYDYQYAPNGRLASITGPFGTERWRYDARDRMVEHVDPSEGTFRFEYVDGTDQVTMIDPSGARTRTAINERGQRILVEDALGGRIASEYDDAGRLVGYTDANLNRMSWAYDAQGRLTERRTPLGKMYAYRYDQRGNLLETTEPGNATAKREYDVCDRLVRMTAGDGREWRYLYDNRDRLTATQEPSGRSSYAYDVLDRVTDYVDPAGAALHLQYDVASRPQAIEVPGGGKLAYEYNGVGLLSSVSGAFGVIRYSYDAVGRLAAIDNPNSTRTTYSYVVGPRVRAITTIGAQGQLIVGEDYEYDSRGNVISIATKTGVAASAGGAAEGLARNIGRSEFAYDALNRLVDARFPDGTHERFTYDRAGNVTNYSKEVAGRYGTRSNATASYGYDADQALVSGCAQTAGGSCAIQYDGFGRLGAWQDQRYEYDDAGHLLGWTGGKGGGARFLYYKDQLVAETTRSGQPVHLFAALPFAGPWAAVSDGSDTFFPIRSANGSVIALSDKNGNLVETCAYGAYAVRSAWSSSGRSARCEFAGGLQLGPGTWFGSRVLAESGYRFMTPDLSGPDKDGNLYAYALGNPLRFVDRRGANSEPLYRTLLQQGGVQPNANSVRQYLVDEFARDAAAAPTPATQQRAQALSNALSNGTIPLKFNATPTVTGTGSYDKISRTATINVEKIAQQTKSTALAATGSDPQGDAFLKAIKSNVIHEAEGHGFGFQDIKLWTENPEAKIMTKWAETGTTPIYGYTRPYSQLQEISSMMAEHRYGDPTFNGLDPLGAYKSDEEALNWISKRVFGTDTIKPPPSYTPEAIAEQNQRVLDLIGEKDFFTHTFPPESNQAALASKNITRLQARLEQAAERSSRAPIATTAGEVAPAEGTVSRALAREAAAADNASAEGLAVRKAAGGALESTATKAGGLLKNAPAGLQRLLGRIAASPITSFTKLIGAAAGEVLLVKDVLDLTVWLGRSAGEAAADLYLALKNNSITKALDDLANKMAALEQTDQQVKARRKARRADLLSRLSPETVSLIRGPPDRQQQPGAPGSSGQGTSTAPSPSGQQGSSSRPPLGPTNPLGQSRPTPGNDPTRTATPGQPQQPSAPRPPLQVDANAKPSASPGSQQPSNTPQQQQSNQNPGGGQSPPTPNAPQSDPRTPVPQDNSSSQNTSARDTWPPGVSAAICGTTPREYNDNVVRGPLRNATGDIIAQCFCFSAGFGPVVPGYAPYHRCGDFAGNPNPRDCFRFDNKQGGRPVNLCGGDAKQASASSVPNPQPGAAQQPPPLPRTAAVDAPAPSAQPTQPVSAPLAPLPPATSGLAPPTLDIDEINRQAAERERMIRQAQQEIDRARQLARDAMLTAQASQAAAQQAQQQPPAREYAAAPSGSYTPSPLTSSPGASPSGGGLGAALSAITGGLDRGVTSKLR